MYNIIILVYLTQLAKLSIQITVYYWSKHISEGDVSEPEINFYINPKLMSFNSST